MKRRTWMMFAAVGAITVMSVADGNAQMPNGAPGPLPQTQPIYSPYLNLLRQGNSPAFNYFGLVRPELNFSSSVYGLQQQAVNTQQTVGQIQSGLTTGHQTMFLNYGGYYQSNRGGTGAGGAPR